MIGFTVLAFSVLIWQSRDLSVDITSRYDSENEKIVISVLNTAGSTLLFYENSAMSGKIEYLSDNGWVEYCDVCYTTDNINAFSTKYGGTFAELRPGESWKVSIPEDKMEGMQNGTYRIKFTYITEEKYNKYIELQYKNHVSKLNGNNSEGSIVSGSEISGNVSIDTSADISGDVSFDYSADENSNESSNLSGITSDNSSESSGIIGGNESSEASDIEIEDTEPELFLAESQSEVYIKTFEYIAPERTDSSDIEVGGIIKTN